jgi:hypothetical protein
MRGMVWAVCQQCEGGREEAGLKVLLDKEKARFSCEESGFVYW